MWPDAIFVVLGVGLVALAGLALWLEDRARRRDVVCRICRGLRGGLDRALGHRAVCRPCQAQHRFAAEHGLMAVYDQAVCVAIVAHLRGPAFREVVRRRLSYGGAGAPRAARMGAATDRATDRDGRP